MNISMKIKKNNGSAYIWVILCMLVLSIMGGTILAISLSDTKHAAWDLKRMQAYYVARSGAEATAEAIIRDLNNARNYLSEAAPPESTGSIGNGSFKAVVTGEKGNKLLITSVGNVDGVTEKISLELLPKSGADFFDKALAQTSKDPDTCDLDLWGMEFTSSTGGMVGVEARGEITLRPGTTNVEEFEYSERFFDHVAVPSAGLEFKGDITGEATVTGNSRFNKIEPKNNVLTFDTQGNEQIIVVDNLILKSDIKIEGGGKVYLYITESGIIQTPLTANDIPSQLFIFVADGKSLQIQANGDVYGYIYAPYATVLLQSDHTRINGSLIGEIVGRNGNQGPHGVINYVPLSSTFDIRGGLLGYKKGQWK